MKTDNTDAAIVLAALEKEAAPLIRSIAKIEVIDNDSYERLATKVAALKQLTKLAEAKESSLVDPLKKVVKDIQALFTPFKFRVAQLERESKAAMLAHVRKLEASKARVKNDLQSGKIAKLSTADKKLSTLELSSTSSQVRKVWVLEEVDASLTPREYLVPDESAIKAALKDGKVVYGWKLVQKETIAI